MQSEDTRIRPATITCEAMRRCQWIRDGAINTIQKVKDLRITMSCTRLMINKTVGHP